MNNKIDLTEQIRSSSRMMVRELGFMRSTLAATNYSPSAIHACLKSNKIPPLPQHSWLNS